MNFKTFLEMVNKSDIPAYLRKNDKMTTKDLEKERTKNRSHPETIKKINGTQMEEVEQIDEKSEQAKRNKTMKNMMDASRGARYKLNNPVPDTDHKTAQAKNKAIGRALRNEETEELEEGRMKDIATNAQETDRLKKKDDVPFDGPYTKTSATTKDKSGAVHTPMSRARDLARQAMKKQMKEDIDRLFEAKDEKEYGYEGDMAMNQLSTLIRCAEMIKDVLKPDTDLPEWVQSKITLASDYIVTAADYLHSELEEQAPCAPVPDKKYIKGTPENKAYKATKKPINGVPVPAKEFARGVLKDLKKVNVKEALKGNQHKIDKNKNGKIDAHDFKLLRKEEEQLDELSKGTLGSYIKKASNDLANKGASLGKKQADADEVDRYTNRHMSGQSDARETMRKAVGASHDDINKVRSGAIKRNKNIGKAVDRLSKEEFENGELETMSKSYKEFVESLNEVKMSDLPSRKVSGSSYGAQYHDSEGDDEEEKPKAKPAADAVKRGRGRPAGAKSGARQGGSAAKTKNGADYTGYKLHLPNKN